MSYFRPRFGYWKYPKRGRNNKRLVRDLLKIFVNLKSSFCGTKDGTSGVGCIILMAEEDRVRK